MRVDSLVQVFLQDGSEEWIFVHIEIQSQADPHLPKRMFFYFCRLGDRYDYPVVSLAVLADSAPDFKPSEYRRETCGCRLHFEYPVCKLMEFDPGELEKSDNPVAVVIAAHLAAQKTARDMEHRLQVKWGLTRRLYERGYSKKEVLELYRLIDWLMLLPTGLALEFRRTMVHYEEEHKMPYITSIERMGIEKGRQEERLAMVLRLTRRRFGVLNLELENRIRALDAIGLEQLSEDLLDFTALADLETWLDR